MLYLKRNKNQKEITLLDRPGSAFGVIRKHGKREKDIMPDLGIDRML